MKKILTIIIALSFLPLLSCSAIIESQMDRLGENLDELGESLDELGEELDKLGENLDSIGDDLDWSESTVKYTLSGDSKYRHGPHITLNKNDKLKTRKFNITNYNALKVGYSFHVVMCDTIDSVTIRINEKLDKYLSVKVERGTLTITLDRIGGITSNDNTKCGYIYLPYNIKLCSFDLSGTSTFFTPLDINATNVNIDLSGASSFKGKVICKRYNVDLSGTSRCRTNTICEKATVELSGASNLENNLICNTLDADLSGTSKLRGNLGLNSCTIDADLSGASSMELAGVCEKAEFDMSGTSKLLCKKLDIKTVEGSMSGASKAQVSCSENLGMNLTGTSHLIYYGNPVTNIEASRATSVEKQ